MAKHMHTIVLLHGWGLSGSSYPESVQLLTSKGFRVLSPDFPGFGESKELSKSLHLSDYVSFLEGYLKKHSLKRPYIIAHSFGGRVALKYLEKHPDGAMRVVLTGVPGYRPVRARRYYPSLIAAKIGNALVAAIPVLHPFRTLLRRVLYNSVGARDYTRATKHLKQTFKNIVQTDLSRAVGMMTLPTLLLWGDRDMVVPVFVPKKMRKNMKNARLHMIPDSGHNPLVDKPELAVGEIVDFLNAHD